jgi:hypothetical protein
MPILTYEGENISMMGDECVEASAADMNLFKLPASAFYQSAKSTPNRLSVQGWHGMQTEEDSWLWHSMPDHAFGTQSETVQLSSELRLVLTSRRGTRRLHTIEMKSGASLALDLTRDLLIISGTEHAIQVAKVEVECLHGVPVSVSAGLWAELMRCREQDSDGMLFSLQNATGMRIHVDRFRQEIRVYGRRSCMHKVYETVAELSTRCSEEIVTLPPWMNEPAGLEMIAEKHAVTITVQEGIVVLRGFTTTVKKAAEEVRSNVLGPPLSSQQMKSRTSSQASMESVSTAAPDGGDEERKLRSDSQSSMGSMFTALPDSGEDLSRWQPTCQVVDVMSIPQNPHDSFLELSGNSDSSCDGPEDVQFVMLERTPPGLSPCHNKIHDKMHSSMTPRGACYIRFGSLETSCTPHSYPSGSTTIVYE